MKNKSRLFLLLIVMQLTACASHQSPAPISSNEALFRVSETKPAGYPKKYIEPQGLNCLEVLEDWRQGEYQGHTVWFNDKKLTTVTCPKPVN